MFVAGVSTLALTLGLNSPAFASPVDIGDVSVQAPAKDGKSDPKAVGSKAEPGTAPALAPAQANLDAVQPGSTISDKVIQDISPPTADYNESLKFAPNTVTTNTNGALGDNKASWRGFVDGQYNITFDGVPFGDVNDPTHHSNAYFPGAFLGSETIDRGPGQASQVGYAPFGGTLSLKSYELSDKFGGNITSSIGTWGTFTAATTLQSGLLDKSGTKLMVQYDHEQTNGALQYGYVRSDYFLGKIQHVFGDFTVTAFSSVGLEHYNNVNPITAAQLALYGKSYGQVNGNPLTQQFVGYNNSFKATDLDYINIEGNEWGWNFHNKAYSYAYWYPTLQNNGNDQTIEGPSTIANGGTINSIKMKTLFQTLGYTTGTPSVNFTGVNNGDVTGYVKNNNYRGFGDIFSMDRDFKAGMASGTLNMGVWWEYVDNSRLQQYYDYTQGKVYGALNPTISNPAQVTAGNTQTVLNAALYKLNLTSQIQNVQPFIEYHWMPTDRLTITPGVKWESFNRIHDGLVNQTTLAPVNFSKSYTAALPFLDIRYKVTPELTVYGQASQGFQAPTVSAFYVANINQANISPERTTNFQAGAIYKNNKWSVDADVYSITATNFPLVTTFADGTSTYTNAGTARYQGAEAEGTYVIQNGMSVYGSGALSSAKYVGGPNSGYAIGDAPTWTAAGGFIYDDQKWFGSLLYKVNGPMYGSNGQCGVGLASNAACANGVGNGNKISPYNETDFVVGYKADVSKQIAFLKKVEVRLGVNNIFDNRSVVEIGGTPTAPAAMTYQFQPGRYIFTQVKADF